jgi:hypothetical protein
MPPVPVKNAAHATCAGRCRVCRGHAARHLPAHAGTSDIPSQRGSRANSEIALAFDMPMPALVSQLWQPRPPPTPSSIKYSRLRFAVCKT